MAVVTAICAIHLSCRKDRETFAPVEDSGAIATNPEYWAGGEGTVFVSDNQAYNQALANLSSQHKSEYLSGISQFFSIFNPVQSAAHGGLGPQFNMTSCRQCHRGNGRSQPPMSEDDLNTGLLIRLSIAGEDEHGGPLGVPAFGSQLQTRATDENPVEGKYYIDYVSEQVMYADGNGVAIYQPYINFYNLYETMPAGVLKSARNASPVFGLGLLEAVSDQEIISRADEQDANGDYISGKVNNVWDIASQSMKVGRFGWKASSPTIMQQNAEAFNQDMGVTSELIPNENCSSQTNCVGGSTTEYDITMAELEQLESFIRGIAVPAPRHLEAEEVQQGRQLFYDIGCTGCHTPQLITGESEWVELSHQIIYPYTDLLLHDLGEVLGDGRPDFEASANEWRTAPLWGIGLTKVVNPDAKFLHDGRASTLEEAILWHGGEAYWAKNAFIALTAAERAAVIAFLNAL